MASALRHISSTPLSATTRSCWASLGEGLATPTFLGYRPSRLPVGETCVAIERRRRCRAAACLRAAPPVDFAAPSFFFHRPTRHPVRKALGTIVRIWRWRSGRGHGRWHRWWHRWCHCGATPVVNTTTPGRLSRCPRALRVNCTIVGINISSRSGRRRGWRGRGSGRGRWRRRGRSCGAAHCSSSRRRAPHVIRHATISRLLLPILRATISRLCYTEDLSRSALEGLCAGNYWAKEPEQERQQ